MNISTFGPPIQPGATPFTRTPCGPSSTASVCTAVCSAAFDVEYPPSFGRILRIDIERMNTIDASPCSAAAVREVRDARLRETERAPHVDLVDLAPVIESRPTRTAAHVHAERVVHEDVEPTERRRPCGRRARRPARRRRGWWAPPAPARRRSSISDCTSREVVGVARREHDRRAFAGQRPRVRLPEPRTDARDDRDLAVEQHCARRSERHERARTSRGRAARSARAGACRSRDRTRSGPTRRRTAPRGRTTAAPSYLSRASGSPPKWRVVVPALEVLVRADDVVHVGRARTA